jgi:DNA polymerase-3 subunit beta
MTTTAVASLTVTRSALLDGLARVALVVPRGKPSIPVVMCVHIEGTAKGLRMSGTDFDRTVTTTVAADGAEDFPARVVPCHRLMSIVDRLPVGPIDITPTESGIRVTAQRAKFDVKGVAVDEWPRAEHAMDKATSVTIAAPLFVKALTRAATCCSSERSRPILNGVHVTAEKNGRLVIIGTDGFRLDREYVERGKGPALDLILPSSSVAAIAKLFASAERLTLELQDRHAIVAGDQASGDAVVFETRLIEGPYPNVHHVINQSWPHEAVIDPRALLAAVRRVTALSAEERFLVRLEWNAEHVTVTGTGDEDAGNSEDVVPCTLSSDAPIRITFAPRLLVAALTLRDSDSVRIGLHSAERSMSLRDVDAADVQNLVMPRRDLGGN